MLRLINGLIPHFYDGKLCGTIKIKGKVAKTTSLSELSKIVGSVFQNPSTQFFNVDTTSELVFGCENFGLEFADIDRRLKETQALFNLAPLMNRSIFELSGGEKQRIACASVYATSPEIFVMDEPAANLDHNSINQLAIIINDLKKLGKTVIISEHQLFYLKGLADRYFYMEKGKIKHEYSANIFESMSAGELLGLGLRSIYRKTLKKRISQIEGTERKLTFEGLKFKRGRQTILDIEAMHFKKGEIVAITGNNGSGKTTLVQCISGMLKHNGHVSYCGNKMRRRRMIEKSYVVMQDVNTQLFAESVIEEVGLNIPDTRKQEVHRTLCTLNLSDKAEVHPMSLSGGEKQRVAIASSIVAEKEVLIFDEPTSGLDFKSMGKMSELIKSVIDKVFCVIIVTHDNELIERCCDRVIHLKDGQIEYSHYIQKVK